MLKKDKNPITKVVFYEIEIDGIKIKEAAVFRKDGVYLEDKDTGIDALHELLAKKGNKSLEEYKELGYFDILSEEQLKEKYPNIYEAAKNIDEYENDEELEYTQEENDGSEIDNNEIIEENDEEILDDINIKKLVLRNSIYLIAGGFALCGFIGLSKKVYSILSNKNTNSKEVTNSDENYTVTEEIDNTSLIESETATDMLQKYGSFDAILEKSNINITKSNTISNVWSYLNNYNTTISNHHKSSISNTRLAHTWDEVVVQYFAYNNVSRDEVSKTFDNYSIIISAFKDAYEKGYEQDVLAYTVLKEATNKIDIINSTEGKQFYQKYENLIIKYNKTYDNKNKDLEKVINEFYDTIRQDFNINENIDDYKLSVIPIIDAFDTMLTRSNYEKTLTEEEKKYFKELSSFSIIENKISDLSDSLSSYNIATNALNDSQDEYTYDQIKEAGITELENKQAYRILDTYRDISDHSEYQDKFAPAEISTTEETTEQVKEVVNTNSSTNYNYNSYTNNNSSYNYDTTGVIEDNEEEDEIPNWMLEDNDQKDVSKPKKETSTKNNIKINKDSTEDIIYDIEKDTPSVNIEDNNYENIDDSIKDITTDDTDMVPVNTLPDPNDSTLNDFGLSNELVANYIINKIANDTSSAKTNNQYTKRI